MRESIRQLFVLGALLYFCFLLHSARGQAGIGLWTNSFNGSGNYNDVPTSIAVDADGNAYVTGYSVLGYFSTASYITIGYSSAGFPLWTNRYDGVSNGWDVAKSVAVDRGGNVYVTGSSSGVESVVDYATIKYSRLGVPLWTNRYAGPWGQDEATAVVADESGNAYITGNSYGFSGDIELATIKYSSTGQESWVRRDGGANGGYGLLIALDHATNVFVAGFFINNSSSTDYALIKYSSDGSGLWSKSYNGPGNSNDEVHGLVIDGNGDVIITGTSQGIGSGLDIATIKYSGAGLRLWTNRYNGPGNGSDYATSIAVDSAGNVLVAGYSEGLGTGRDFVTIKFSSAGNPLWTNRYSSPGSADDSPVAIAADSSGNAFVVGSSGTSAYVMVAYSGDGQGIWTNQVSPVAAMALDKYGNVYLTGSSSGIGSRLDYLTVKRSSLSPSPIPLQIQNEGDAFVLGWADARFGLQAAPFATGTFTNVPGALSPYTNSASDAQRFFRLEAH